jgi:hypothetical protein
MKARDRLGLDVTALLLIVVQTNPAISRITIHELIGVALIVPLATHVVLNWTWVTTAIGKFLGKMRPTMRFNLVIDTGLFLSMVCAGFSGVLIVPGLAPAIGLSASPLWHAVHLAAANLTIAFLLAHFSLHARWMFNALRRVVSPSATKTPKRVAQREGVPVMATGATSTSTGSRSSMMRGV